MNTQIQRCQFAFLLVEDDDDHAALTTRALQATDSAGVVFRARDGEEALRYLQDHPRGHRPDAILLDLKLPRKTGYELLHDLKEDPKLSSIPVVVLTSSHADSDRERATTLRADRYVVKPLDISHAIQIVQELRLRDKPL